MKKISLMLDSGAFSAFTKNVQINIDSYIRFIKDHHQYIDYYINLDVIGNAEKTYENQKIMEKAGLTPIPVFHVMFEKASWLKEYINEGYKYIGLGGLAGTKFTKRDFVVKLDSLFESIIGDKQGLPKTKIHGFGMTSLKLMLRYPWYSVDSTSWVMTSRMGGVYVPQYKSGEWVYDENSWKISVSTKSPDKLEAGQHITTLSKQQREHIFTYFTEKGYKLGSSEFRFESEKYKLKKDEKWGGKAASGKREVETIIEAGLCNDYKLRDELNIIYYLDLEKHMPEWPWAFKAKGVERFEL